MHAPRVVGVILVAGLPRAGPIAIVASGAVLLASVAPSRLRECCVSHGSSGVMGFDCVVTALCSHTLAGASRAFPASTGEHVTLSGRPVRLHVSWPLRVPSRLAEGAQRSIVVSRASDAAKPLPRRASSVYSVVIPSPTAATQTERSTSWGQRQAPASACPTQQIPGPDGRLHIAYIRDLRYENPG